MRKNSAQSHFWDTSREEWVRDGSPHHVTSTDEGTVTAYMVIGSSWHMTHKSKSNPRINFVVRS